MKKEVNSSQGEHVLALYKHIYTFENCQNPPSKQALEPWLLWLCCNEMKKKEICEIYSCLHKFQLKGLNITYIWCKGQNFDEIVQAIKCYKIVKIS